MVLQRLCSANVVIGPTKKLLFCAILYVCYLKPSDPFEGCTTP